MTLPASGEIGFDDLNTEMGVASTTSLSWSFVKSRTKPVDTVNSLGAMYGLVWVQRNNDCTDTQSYFQSNCNCNCDCACDCGNCSNCGSGAC